MSTLDSSDEEEDVISTAATTNNNSQRKDSASYQKRISKIFSRLVIELKVENFGMQKRLNQQYVFHFYLKKGITVEPDIL